MYFERELSYRKSAIEGASPIGLTIALYDTLWRDVHRAADAVRCGDIETRCRYLDHAILILGQLEDWVVKEDGDDLSTSLSMFYGYVRAKILEASAKQSAAPLEEAMEHILTVRGAWQQRDMATAQQVAITEEPSVRQAISFSA